MELKPQDIKKLALLSRLHVPEGEIDAVITDLQPILGHFEELASLDLSDVPPMMHPDSGIRPLREDEPHVSLPRDTALANAPEARDGMFFVPKVM